MTDTRLSFKEMCAMFEVTPRTLRYYEYIELLAPEKEGRARFYGAREVARMKLILRGRRFGFSLEEIRQWLLIYGKTGEKQQLQQWIDLADRQLVALEKQPLKVLEAKATFEKNKISAFGQIQSQFSSLADVATRISTASAWTARTATSSNTAAAAGVKSRGASSVW